MFKLFSRKSDKREGAIIWTKKEVANARKVNRMNRMDAAGKYWESASIYRK